jgi:ankyrin repeat protein
MYIDSIMSREYDEKKDPPKRIEQGLLYRLARNAASIQHHADKKLIDGVKKGMKVRPSKMEEYIKKLKEIIQKDNANPAEFIHFPRLLEDAVNHENEEMIDFLIENNVDVNISSNPPGWTPLILAVRLISPDKESKILRKLLSVPEVEINLDDKQGRTALHHAVVMKSPQRVQMLLDHGADTALEDNNGKKAIDYADTPQIRDIIQRHMNTHANIQGGKRKKYSRTQKKSKTRKNRKNRK